MARGRFISKSITTDREINLLSSDTCRLAFTWLLTFTDCEGRVTGEPDLLVSALFPRRHDVTSASLEAFIQEWAACGFVVWFLAPDGDRYLQFLNFAKHQLGLRKNKEPASSIPNPADCRILAGSLPIDWQNLSTAPPPVFRPVSAFPPPEVKDEIKSEVKVQGEEEDKGKANSQPADAAADSQTCFNLYEQEIGPLTPTILNKLQAAFWEYGSARLSYAIQEASQHNVRNWKYIQAILQSPTSSSPLKTPPPKSATALDVVKAEMSRLGYEPTGILSPLEPNHV